MRLRFVRIMAALASAGLAALASAQSAGPVRGLEKAELLQNKSIQDELKITPEQHKKFRDLARDFEKKHKEEIAKAREDKDFRKMMDVRRKAMEAMSGVLGDVLTAEQLKRLGQIDIQAQGLRALMRSEVQKQLGLSARQREEVRSIFDGMEKELKEAFKTPPADAKKAQEFGTKLRKVHQTATERAEAIFNDEQRAIWKEMTGEPFEVKLASPRGQPGRH
jgi:hypothetical protein